ncbi:MAG: Fic/DOC family N-terminal domain-containing protein, partial [Gemmatimonadota bacterium]
MLGRFVTLVWKHKPTLYAPPKYRRACSYRAFIPEPIAGTDFSLDARIAGVVSDAENAIRELNAPARPALAPLARLLLRTESIASSKVEGMQIGVRELARAEARVETGAHAGPTAREVIANIDAMELAIQEATAVERFSVEEILAIHRTLMERSSSPQAAGRSRTVQNWIGGNDYN